MNNFDMKLLIFSILFAIIVSAKSSSFPPNFLFGSSTASYPIEGAWNADGKGESIWDRLSHTHPELTNNDTGDIASDFYHKYKEDVKLMKEIGFDMHRFSISWTRILPTGDITQVNEAGIRFYKNLLDELLENNIQPMVTIYHWDLPQKLQDIGGWANPLIVDYVEDYADLLFKHLGDKVKWWITINEPLTISYGYDFSTIAPSLHLDSPANYIVGYNCIKAHARIFRLYEKKYRSTQNGKLSMSLQGPHCLPKTNSDADKQAAERAFQFFFGWFANPIYSKTGDYPEIMKTTIAENSKKEGRNRSRLPSFTTDEIAYIRGTFDYFALSHYSSNLCSAKTNSNSTPGLATYYRDMYVQFDIDPKWPTSAASWLYVVPEGMSESLKTIKNHYGDVPIFISSNGYADSGDIQDTNRVSYHQSYLKEVAKAIQDYKCNVIGYSMWSIIDGFEWNDGFGIRYGLVHVNNTDPGRKRTPKLSFNFFKDFLKTRTIS